MFSKYLFAVPLTLAYAGSVAKALVSIFSSFLSDMGASFVAKLQCELTDLLEIHLQNASLKLPQTIGLFERSHSKSKCNIKLNTDASWTSWYRYVDRATLLITLLTTHLSDVPLDHYLTAETQSNLLICHSGVTS